MSDSRRVGPATYNVEKILDCHTHLTGMEGESAESILEYMDVLSEDCRVRSRQTAWIPL